MKQDADFARFANIQKKDVIRWSNMKTGVFTKKNATLDQYIASIEFVRVELKFLYQ